MVDRMVVTRAGRSCAQVAAGIAPDAHARRPMACLQDHVDVSTWSTSSLTVSVVSARNVLPADPDGLSDPYVKLFIGDSGTWRSPTKHKTLNPNWNVEVNFTVADLSRAAYALCEIWDADTGTADDPLGEVVLPLGQMLLCGDGTEVDLAIGRSRKAEKTSGTIRLRVSAASTTSGGERPRSPLLAHADEFSRRCGVVDANPAGLGPPAVHPDLLEAVFPEVTLSWLGSLAIGTLYVSNVRLLFVPSAGRASSAHEDGAYADEDDDLGRCGLCAPDGTISAPLRCVLRSEYVAEPDRGSHSLLAVLRHRGDKKEKPDVSGGIVSLSLLPSLELAFHFNSVLHGSGTSAGRCADRPSAKCSATGSASWL